MSGPSAFDEIAVRVERETETIVDAMERAIVASVPAFGADATIRAEVRASCRANAGRFLHRVRHADDPPTHGVPPEALDLARTVVRRGIAPELIYEGYRRGQQELWRHWMAAAEGVVAAERLPDVLNRSLDLLIRFADNVVSEVIGEVDRERALVAAGALDLRAETIRLLLDDAPVDPIAAGARLRYELDREHTALILWAEQELPQGALERVAATISSASGMSRPLTSPAGVSTLWAWIPGPLADGGEVGDAIGGTDPLRIATGTTRQGPAGFRRSHEEAVAVQRLVRRHASPGTVSTFAELEVTALVSEDEDRAREFVQRTLGALAAPDARAARLRETLRVFLDEAEHAPRAALRLHTHRNTVLQRVTRATELLGHRPGDRRLAVALALELDRRLGPRAPRA